MAEDTSTKHDPDGEAVQALSARENAQIAETESNFEAEYAHHVEGPSSEIDLQDGQSFGSNCSQNPYLRLSRY
jgi:hypothetical protein